MIIGIFLTVAIILCGLWRYPGGIPLGATCSVVISAACHQPIPDDQDACRFPIQWGAISHPRVVYPGPRTASLSGDGSNETLMDDDTSTPDAEHCSSLQEGLSSDRAVGMIIPGHCCFTTARNVEPPREGKIYS
jgi:hypothetical protein